MNGGSRSSKYFLATATIVILIVLAYFIFKINSNPYKVLTPDNYAPGTTVSLYKNVPPDFPRDVILENNALNSSDAVATPGGKTQIKVSYKSDKSVAEILSLYRETLPGKGWQVLANDKSAIVATILATKENESVLITIATIKELGTGKDIGALVTFQYEK